MGRWNPGHLLVAVLTFTAVAFAGGIGPALAQTAPVIDLTGETCLSGSATIDPDGPGGPLPPQTYCVMNGRLPAGYALEMDNTDGMPPVAGSAVSVADGNLFQGGTVNDPDLPFVSGAIYIDWADLPIAPLTGAGAAPLGSVENYRILDFTANGDYTMLRPQAASCLNDGSVLPKEDFTQSYIANNDEFLYFAQERRTNNGNSVYYWLLTQEPPIVNTMTGDCGSNTRGQLQFNLTAGDVELLVNFPDSSDPAGGGVFFRNYTGSASGYIPARDAVFDPGWSGLQAAPIRDLSINITGDGDDDYGPWGGFTKQGNPVASGSYDTATFAEWAVDLVDVFSGSALCGRQLFVTGLSRSSTGQIGSLDEPAALKDTVGPKLFSFGQISAQASLTPTCDLGFSYSAEAFGFDGSTPLDPNGYTCAWVCDDDDGRGVTLSAASACSGTGTIPRGDGSPDGVTCTVTITETASGCSADDDGQGTVFAPLVVSIAPDTMSLGCTVPGAPGSDNGTIGPGVTYTPTISGGDGAYSLTWSVSGPNTATCTANAPVCVVDIPDGTFCGRTNVGVTVDDGEPLCPAAQSNTGVVIKTTSVTAN